MVRAKEDNAVFMANALAMIVTAAHKRKPQENRKGC
jgi:hypothetical protein